jgi:Ca2+-binding RTX toxin-like protein
MFGGTDHDVLRGGTGSDELFGGDGDDSLFSNGPYSSGGPVGADTGFVTYLDTVGDAALDAADTLDGGAGNDTITVAHDFTGTTTIDGGDDTDELRFGVDGSRFLHSPPADIFNSVDLEAQTGTTPFGGQMIVRGIENVTGDDYRDVFRGDDNANILRGNDGDDRLEGRGGADTLDGGAGAHDVADYASSLGVDVDLERATQLRNDAQGDILIDIEDIDGSKYADNLRGDDGANHLFGNNGGDLLEGRGGADTLDGGLGTDVASYESSALGVNVRLDDQGAGTASFAFGGDADGDTLISIENLVGSVRNDVFAGNSGINRIEGGNGNDVIHGLDGGDTLLGQGGDDTVSGDGGNDVVDGGLGNDVLYGNDGTDTVSFESWDALATGSGALAVFESIRIELGQGSQDGHATRTVTTFAGLPTTSETDTLNGFENVRGSNKSEGIVGNSGGNVLEGRDGNDVLQGNGGSDTLDGGNGIDTASYEGNGDRVIVNLGTNADGSAIEFAIVPTVGEIIASVDTLRGIENVRGSVFSDQITGNSLDNVLDGNAGADLLQGAAGNDTYIVDNAADAVIEQAGQGLDTVRAAVSYALNGSEVENLETTNAFGTTAINLTGNALANTITGNAGANIIDGRDGSDTVSYANNRAHVQVELLASGTDSVAAEFAGPPGQDVLVSIDTLRSIENVRGSAFNDIINGNELDNTLDGNGGADTLTGRAGNDSYVVDNALDIVVENANEGKDTIQSSVTYALSANVENLTLTGTIGASGVGNGLANTIVGNSAANFIDGGAGADTLVGGGDNDLFVFRPGEANGDTVLDFAGNGVAAGDRIQFVGYGPGATLTQVDATHWQVNYHGGADHDVIAFANAAAIHTTDFLFA